MYLAQQTKSDVDFTDPIFKPLTPHTPFRYRITRIIKTLNEKNTLLTFFLYIGIWLTGHVFCRYAPQPFATLNSAIPTLAKPLTNAIKIPVLKNPYVIASVSITLILLILLISKHLKSKTNKGGVEITEQEAKRFFLISLINYTVFLFFFMLAVVAVILKAPIASIFFFVLAYIISPLLRGILFYFFIPKQRRT